MNSIYFMIDGMGYEIKEHECTSQTLYLILQNGEPFNDLANKAVYETQSGAAYALLTHFFQVEEL